MIDHITFSVSSIVNSTAFYDQAFAPLGVKQLFDASEDQSDGAKVIGCGDDRPHLWLVEDTTPSGALHIALKAQNMTTVDAFHAAAILAGGADNGPPGFRPHYHPNYYAAFVLDPDGNNIEAVCYPE